MADMENATIKEASIGFEDHGILTVTISFDGCGWAQGLGHYPMDQWCDKQKTRVAHPNLSAWVLGILRTLELSSWDQIAGSVVRVRRGDDRSIVSMGHPVKDKWFTPNNIAAEFRGETQ